MIHIEQSRWTSAAGWQPGAPGKQEPGAALVFVFGGRLRLGDTSLLSSISSAYPSACLIGCSTAGELCDVEVSDDSIVCTAMRFEDTRCRGVCMEIARPSESYGIGEQIAAGLAANDLRHVFLFSDGIHVNGTDLVRGITAGLPSDVTVTGGLAGDGVAFAETCIVWQGEALPRRVAAVGLYGDHLTIGYGSFGGWDPFGPERLVTKSNGSVLYALDGISALDLYRQYLGEHAKGLPATGLLFPLSIRMPDSHTELVRTILQIDERNHSMIFAGDIPEGSYARMMKANFDRLIDGAVDSARRCTALLPGHKTDLALLVSCVGRRMVLKQRVEEEVEGVREVLGARPVMTGFYSYGEISPMSMPAKCELHNQTMTITTLAEKRHA